MSDPESLPGLAHFCEHMLFLGTKRYPGEGDFEKYIGANGGMNNAYTASEETCYFFDVSGDALPGAAPPDSPTHVSERTFDNIYYIYIYIYTHL